MYRKIRSDRKCPIKCPHCDYTGPNNTNTMTHILNNHCTADERVKDLNIIVNIAIKEHSQNRYTKITLK